MVKVRKDLTGQKFGRLTVIKQAEDYIKPDGRHESMWLCECDCGNQTVVIGDKLKSKRTKSCGCLSREISRENAIRNFKRRPKIYNVYDLTSFEYGVGYTSKGEEFYFNLEDYDKIKDYTWYINNLGYVISSEKIYMHILIMNSDGNQYVIDHINHKKFDNRKCNLRVVAQSKNSMNKCMQSNNTSGATGVSLHKNSKRWFAYIKVDGKQTRVYANSKEEAIRKRKELEEQFFGEFSYENSIGE